MTADKQQQLSLPNLVSSEWLKLRSLRSFWFAAAGVVLLTAAGALLPALFFTADNPPTEAEAPLLVFRFGAMGGQIALLVLAVLALTSEYSSGSIRLTLVAAPRRLRVIAAKAVVVTAVSALLAVVSLPVAYVVCVPKLNSLGLHPASRSIIGGFAAHVGYLILVAAFAFAVALAVRSTAAGVGIGLGVVFVLPSVLSLLGGGLHQTLDKLGFTDAANSLFYSHSSIGTLLTDAVTVTVWVAVPLLIGGMALVRRDA
ncbi:ABC transporter permease subunit [Actinoplanes sp. NBRC 103695]|uniref:ABC transporter permease subunit n=1 Tax=Actinoplanes sp. NBRC 103695 TaxID=3032202 RepID=UPI0024A14393|nr:ABC transporter permease subunit [Actinoplanes sp. NBRC 103695]GLY97258.1 ABC transporter [Actinoplanes sp. NBRC 103695]